MPPIMTSDTWKRENNIEYVNEFNILFLLFQLFF